MIALSARRGIKRKPMAEINVVPYIDVMLVLLIIFMITTPLLTQGVQVNLPKANAKTLSTEKTDPVIISVDQAGQLYLNVSDHPDEALSAQQLAVRVAAQLKLDQAKHLTPLILVKGDSQVNYGNIVQAMALLQHIGVNNVGLMTDLAHPLSPVSSR